ncbi:MAG: 3D domain-containing protein [Alicyclobacillaceae bacterium]|nr:3D domain-containing protein [Alicyclobacillaceae bacterium]
MRIPKSKTLYVLLSLLMVLFVGGWTTAQAAFKTVTVQDNGKRKVLQGYTFGTLGDFLKEHSVAVPKRAHVYPSLNTPVSNGMQVSIVSPDWITLEVEGHMRQEWTFAHTVSEVLQLSGVRLNKEDHVSEPMNSPIVNDETIDIVESYRRVITKTQVIPFQTIQRLSQNLFSGQRQVLSYGVKGLLQEKTTSYFVNGSKVKQTIQRKLLRKVRNEIVLEGTAPRTFEVSSRSYSPGLFAGQITVLATAYVEGGITSTGWVAKPGIIAVDPQVIPYGTKLFIPDVGVVRAEDSGADIIGYHIDICMSSYQLAEEWGARTITAYILR